MASILFSFGDYFDALRLLEGLPTSSKVSVLLDNLVQSFPEFLLYPLISLFE